MANNITKIVAIAAFILAAIALFVSFSPPQLKELTGPLNFGALGVKLAENYDPYIRYNQGYYSLLPLTLQANLQGNNLTLNSTTETINGFTTTVASTTLVAATTTPCAFQAPNATTTLVSFTVNVTTATSSAGTFAIGTSTTNSAFATTTSVGTGVIAANNTGNVTVIPTGTNTNILSPNQWVTVGVSGVSYGYTLGGYCDMVTRTI